VPKGTARLRITLCATHTQADIQRLLQALTEAAVALSPEACV
jgi:8-amino-7-oxononanoate synthase